MPKPELKRTKAVFFQPSKDHKKHEHEHEQVVNVNVVINEKEDDAVSNCFKALFSCTKKAAQ